MLQQLTPMNESDSRSTPPTEAPSRLSQAIRWFREKVGTRPEGNIKEMLEEALDEVLVEDTTISAEEKSLLKNMIHFGELTARDVMLPRSDILGVKRDVSVEELKQHVITIGHTRIPVFEDSLDNIEGFIHVKDLFPYLMSSQPFKISQVIRDILFIPPSMRIVDLLMKMRVSGCHIAIVVDEFGGTDGLVTMEDLFEELVGEIQDEHDEHETASFIRRIGDHILEVDARTNIPDLNNALGEPLTENGNLLDTINTLGGFIIQELGRVPVRGEVVMLKPNLKAEIVAADPRRIRQVRLTKTTNHPSN
jgi:CBS domain containing-hemolysin-like protein